MAASVRKTRRRSVSASTAERQAAYRRRHLNEVDTVDSARLNMIVPVAIKRALERLAKRYAVTQREMLGKLVGDAERAVTGDMSTADLRRYYGDAAAE
jgi:hypothetical protein